MKYKIKGLLEEQQKYRLSGSQKQKKIPRVMKKTKNNKTQIEKVCYKKKTVTNKIMYFSVILIQQG